MENRASSGLDGTTGHGRADAGDGSILTKRSNGVRGEIDLSNNNSARSNDTNGQGHVNTTSILQRLSSNVKDIFDPSETSIFVPVLSIRIFSIIAWTLSILYATYHVYLACENEWFSDPVMNPSALSGVFNRGKDATDYEWEIFTFALITRLWMWYGGYVLTCRIIQPVLPREWGFISLGVSLAMMWDLVGFLPTLFMLSQPATYWIIARTRSKFLAWSATIIFIYNLNSPLTRIFIPENDFSEYFYVITSAWNYARCISFCYDVWERNGDNDTIGLKYLENVTRFCFYLPLIISGPLVTYESFERNIINRDIRALQERNFSEDFITLLKKLGKIGLIALLNEVILHFLYFRSLSMTPNVHQHLSLWAVCGTIYWLGQFFAMKYKVLYGIPTVIAEFDGMEMPTLPTCPSYIHRYSALWREFDAGLYRFLVKYIYVPTLKYIQEKDTSKKIPADVQKLMASFVSYVYIYIWHSLSFDVFIWTALNFIGITIERIGSVIKREIDRRKHVKQIHWDFVIEPIITVPLAAMSILNSSIFCGSMDAAQSFGRELWKRRQDNWVFVFLYFFTHTAVTHRTWRHKLYQLYQKSKVA